MGFAKNLDGKGLKLISEWTQKEGIHVNQEITDPKDLIERIFSKDLSQILQDSAIQTH